MKNLFLLLILVSVTACQHGRPKLRDPEYSYSKVGDKHHYTFTNLFVRNEFSIEYADFSPQGFVINCSDIKSPDQVKMSSTGELTLTLDQPIRNLKDFTEANGGGPFRIPTLDEYETRRYKSDKFDEKYYHNLGFYQLESTEIASLIDLPKKVSLEDTTKKLFFNYKKGKRGFLKINLAYRSQNDKVYYLRIYDEFGQYIWEQLGMEFSVRAYDFDLDGVDELLISDMSSDTFLFSTNLSLMTNRAYLHLNIDDKLNLLSEKEKKSIFLKMKEIIDEGSDFTVVHEYGGTENDTIDLCLSKGWRGGINIGLKSDVLDFKLKNIKTDYTSIKKYCIGLAEIFVENIAIKDPTRAEWEAAEAREQKQKKEQALADFAKIDLNDGVNKAESKVIFELYNKNSLEFYLPNFVCKENEESFIYMQRPGTTKRQLKVIIDKKTGGIKTSSELPSFPDASSFQKELQKRIIKN